MSGEKIDMDEIRDQSNFDGAKLVIEDDDSPTIEIAEETFDEAVSKPVENNSSTKTIKNDDGIVINSSTKKIQKKDSSTREIAEAIKDVIKSSRKTEMKSSRRIRNEASSRRVMMSSQKRQLTSQKKEMESQKRQLSSNSKDKSDVATKKSRLPEINSKTKPVTPDDSYKHKTISEKRRREKEKKAKKEDEDSDDEDSSEEDIDMMPKTPAEKHLYWKTRIQILKTRFKDVTVPKNEADLTWQELRKIYYIEMDRVSITKNVDAYRMIMIVSCFIIEYIGYKILKVDITGFGVHSMKSMWRYERLLIELGEKDYASFGENWPVEFRLIGMMIVSAIIFVIAKSLFKQTGQDMSNDFFKFFQDLGNQSYESDMNSDSNGMDAPNPNDNGQGGGIMSMLSGLMGGGNGGGGGIMDMVGNLMKGFNQQEGVKPAEKTETEDLSEDDEERNRINPPRLRRKSRSARAREAPAEE
tara:strand:+ start:1355 stop:2764 length:1410 start_codon:yes stop_codon:yes gene_type:complete